MTNPCTHAWSHDPAHLGQGHLHLRLGGCLFWDTPARSHRFFQLVATGNRRSEQLLSDCQDRESDPGPGDDVCPDTADWRGP